MVDSDARVVLVTDHRCESFGGGFERICAAVRMVAHRFPDVQFIFPIPLNPNVQKPAQELLSRLSNVKVIAPLGYAPLARLMDQAHLT